jgi:5'-nucleotidase/UDP-sugar diphosphatase
MIESIRKSEPATLLLDCGALFDDKKDTAEFQLQAMALMGYDALNLGSPEFMFGKEFLEQTRSRISFPYISSNLLSGGSRIPWTREYLIKEVGGVKVAIFGVLDPDGLARLPGREQVKGLEVIPPEAALKRLLPEVRGKVDLVILLSQLDVENTLALVQAVKGIDVAISSAIDNVFFPPATEKDTAVLLQTGSLGKTLGLLKITLDEKRVLRVSEKKYVPLDNSVPGNREIERLAAAFKKAHETEQEKFRRAQEEKIRKEQQETLRLSPQEFLERYQKEQTSKGGAR